MRKAVVTAKVEGGAGRGMQAIAIATFAEEEEEKAIVIAKIDCRRLSDCDRQK